MCKRKPDLGDSLHATPGNSNSDSHTNDSGTRISTSACGIKVAKMEPSRDLAGHRFPELEGVEKRRKRGSRR